MTHSIGVVQWRVRGAWLGLMALSAVAPSSGQGVQVYDMITAGLPSNTVRAILPLADGDVWAGTDWGLCHFDGTDWEVLQVGTSGLPENDIRSLALDSSGVLWVGTFSAGLVRYDAGAASWTVYNAQNSGLPADQVRALHVDPWGHLWVGTPNGLARFDGALWQVFDDSPNSYAGLILPGSNITEVIVRPDSVAVIGTVNGGFVYLASTGVTFFNTFNDGLPDNTALGIAIDQAGDRWSACPAGALLRHAGSYQGGVWNQYSSLNSFIPSNSLNDVAIDAADRKIIATQNAGLAIFEGLNTWSVFNSNNSDLPDDEVLTVTVDPVDGIWAGTATGGLVHIASPSGVPGPHQNSTFRYSWSEDGRSIQLFGRDVDKVLHAEILDAAGRSALNGLLPVQGRVILDGLELAPGIYLLALSDRLGHVLGMIRIPIG
ncbi:MAG: hypothetical protein KDB88_06260 [Flavobacteriales bacterium]|nr:hypothetical protein [Flavobacteriales bacterium]